MGLLKKSDFFNSPVLGLLILFSGRLRNVRRGRDIVIVESFGQISRFLVVAVLFLICPRQRRILDCLRLAAPGYREGMNVSEVFGADPVHSHRV